jgi:hypothetical protein
MGKNIFALLSFWEMVRQGPRFINYVPERFSTIMILIIRMP